MATRTLTLATFVTAAWAWAPHLVATASATPPGLPANGYDRISLSIAPSTLETQSQSATTIVHARVVSMRSVRIGAQSVSTVAELEVVDRLKGAGASSLRIRVRGGSTPQWTTICSEAPRLRRGAEYVFFLAEDSTGPATIFGSGQGVYAVFDGADGERRVLGEHSTSEQGELLGAFKDRVRRLLDQSLSKTRE